MTPHLLLHLLYTVDARLPHLLLLPLLKIANTDMQMGIGRDAVSASTAGAVDALLLTLLLHLLKLSLQQLPFSTAETSNLHKQPDSPDTVHPGMDS